MTTSDEYNRGKVDAQLAEHSQHLAKINGSMERVADELHAMTMQVQRLADAADADRATVIVTAQALEKAEAARRVKSEQGWTPFQRVLAVLGVLVALAGTVVAFIALSGH